MSRCARSLPLAALVVLCVRRRGARRRRAAGRPTGRARCRTSTSRARTASAPRATRRSKVWFTVADGVLSDVYFPTNDNTNVETLQYVVTDGSTFTDLQTRDMTYTVKALDDRALTCRVTATAKSGRYKIVTDYMTDPDAPDRASCARRFDGAQGQAARLQASTSASTRRSTATAAAATGNGGADSGAIATRRRPHAARRLGHRHRDQRRQPRLRGPGLSARSTPTAASAQVVQRLRRRSRATASTQLDAEPRA